MPRLVGYTVRFKCHTGDRYLTCHGTSTNMFKPVLSAEQAKVVWENYANSGAFLQLPTVCPVYDYRRRI